jgi:hypothetical protein
VGAGADLIELVLDRGFEEHLAPIHRRHPHRDLDRHAHERGREMLDRDLHADRILAGIGVLDDELAAGVFDVEDHGRGAVGARVLAHETDGAFTADGDAVDPGRPGPKAWLHLFCSSGPYNRKIWQSAR